MKRAHCTNGMCIETLPMSLNRSSEILQISVKSDDEIHRELKTMSMILKPLAMRPNGNLGQD